MSSEISPSGVTANEERREDLTKCLRVNSSDSTRSTSRSERLVARRVLISMMMWPRKSWFARVFRPPEG